MRTPLPVAEPPFAIVQRIYREARASLRWTSAIGEPGESSHTRFHAAVSEAFGRALRDAGIFVEGES